MYNLKQISLYVMGNVTYLSITFYGYIIYELHIGVFVLRKYICLL